jgi:hypothetical protein
MFVTVRINAEIADGSLVCHDANNVWRVATSSDVAPLGCLNSSELDEGGVRWGRITLGGATWARAGASIPEHGGWLACDDQGRAIVSPSEDCGLVAPVLRGATAPALDDLILVYLR